MRIKKIAIVILFLLIFTLLFGRVQSILTPDMAPDWAKETYKYPAFYSLEDDVIDVLFLGTSHDYWSIYPMELYHNYGIRSFNLGSPNQNLLLAYYQLKEAYKTQKFKYVFMDMSTLLEQNKETDFEVNQRYKLLISLPLSKNKIEMISAFSKDKDRDTLLSILIPMYRFHDRWDSLTRTDFEDVIGDDILLGYGANYDASVKGYLGYSTQYVPREVDMTSEYESVYLDTEHVQESERTEMPVIESEASEYFEKIYDFCRQHEIELVPIKVPSIVRWGDAWNQVASSYLGRFGLSILDMTYLNDQIHIDWSTDTSDGGIHLNFRGGLKVSNFMGDWILENCHDLRIGEDFSSKEQWDEDAAKYEELKAELLSSMRTNEQKIHDLFEMIQADKKDYVVCLSVRNDMSTFWNEDMDSYLKALGLEEDFYSHRQESYIAVIDRGEVMYERFSPRGLIYKGTFTDDELRSLYIKSENYKQGDSSSILIDDEEYSLNQPGLNIVVYDITQKKVVKQANINLTISPYQYNER